MEAAHSLALDHARSGRGTAARGAPRRRARCCSLGAAGHRQDRGAGAAARAAGRGRSRARADPRPRLHPADRPAPAGNGSRRCCEAPYEELWIGTWATLCERLLRAHSTAAGLDPFFDVLGPAERLAMLLDRLDELPLRNHEIRGNPAGLLARLLAQIDELKAGLRAARARPGRVLRRPRPHRRRVGQPRPRRRLPHPGQAAATSGPTSAPRSPAASPYLMVDEYEDTTPAQRTILAKLAAREPEPPLRRATRVLPWAGGH